MPCFSVGLKERQSFPDSMVRIPNLWKLWKPAHIIGSACWRLTPGKCPPQKVLTEHAFKAVPGQVWSFSVCHHCKSSSSWMHHSRDAGQTQSFGGGFWTCFIPRTALIAIGHGRVMLLSLQPARFPAHGALPLERTRKFALSLAICTGEQLSGCVAAVFVNGNCSLSYL